jgi:hypothetical protein
MSLLDLVDNTRTDKNTTHSYLDLYQNLLVNKKYTATNILEIGIGTGNQGITDGGSIKLWHDFFPNATIYALDIKPIHSVWDGIKNNTRIVLHTSCDAYNESVVNSLFNTTMKFDFMLDDGPHSLESMIHFIRLYTPLMTDDGLLIIEDVQSWDWIDILKNEVPENLKQFIKIYDLRENKYRYDDIVFTIDKSNN